MAGWVLLLGRPRRPSVPLEVQVADALAEGPTYALTLAERTGLSVGAVYVAVARLEVSGQLTSAVEVQSPTPGKPPRRLYALTALGHNAAALRRPAP